MATRIQGKKITDLGGGYALLTERSGFTGDLLYYPLEQSIGQDGKPFWHKIYGGSWGTPEFSMYKRASIIAYIKKLKQGKKSNPSSASTKSWVTINGVTYIIRSYSGGKLTATVGEKSRKVVATTSKYDSNGLYEKLRNLKKSNPSSLKVKSGEWIPCHAVRVRGEKLEIMKDALANTGKLTLAQAKLMAKQYGGSIKKVDGEYICRYKGQEYFTNDIHDAVGTIKLMSQGR